MPTVIRLKRVGAKKEASYRIVVTDSREGSSGASIERLGSYNPRTQPSWVRIDAARALHWLHEGAQPSDTVRSILRETGVWKQFQDGVDPATLEEGFVRIGPPAGQRGTSQRPAPTDRAPKDYDEAEAAPEPAPEPEAEPEAKADEETVAEAADEETVAEAAEEETVAEAVEEVAEAPATEGEEAPAAETEEAPEAEAEAAAEDEAPAEAAAEAPEEASAETEEAVAEDPDAEGDAEAEGEEE